MPPTAPVNRAFVPAERYADVRGISDVVAVRVALSRREDRGKVQMRNSERAQIGNAGAGVMQRKTGIQLETIRRVQSREPSIIQPGSGFWVNGGETSGCPVNDVTNVERSGQAISIPMTGYPRPGFRVRIEGSRRYVLECFQLPSASIVRDDANNVSRDSFIRRDQLG